MNIFLSYLILGIVWSIRDRMLSPTNRPSYLRNGIVYQLISLFAIPIVRPLQYIINYPTSFLCWRMALREIMFGVTIFFMADYIISSI